MRDKVLVACFGCDGLSRVDASVEMDRSEEGRRHSEKISLLLGAADSDGIASLVGDTEGGIDAVTEGAIESSRIVGTAEGTIEGDIELPRIVGTIEGAVELYRGSSLLIEHTKQKGPGGEARKSGSFCHAHPVSENMRSTLADLLSVLPHEHMLWLKLRLPENIPETFRALAKFHPDKS